MSAIFDALPGFEVSPGDITSALARMWQVPAAHGQSAPASDEMKATQVNLVLHLGFATKPADAVSSFRTAVEFSSSYPSRVVVLCPRQVDTGGVETRAKIYGECFLGKNKEDARCCEFVILNYSMEARRFLESQVSICLSADLPTYYWAHQFQECHRLADYQKLLMRARRFVFDSAAAPADAVTYPWPNPANVRDLAHARMLPVRQSLGQFLAGFSPATLVGGLRRVVCSFEAVHIAEGRALLRWVKDRLHDCGAEQARVVWDTAELPYKGGACFALRFEYEGDNRFEWQGNCDTGIAHFAAKMGDSVADFPSHIQLLSAPQALSEALFF